MKEKGRSIGSRDADTFDQLKTLLETETSLASRRAHRSALFSSRHRCFSCSRSRGRRSRRRRRFYTLLLSLVPFIFNLFYFYSMSKHTTTVPFDAHSRMRMGFRVRRRCALSLDRLSHTVIRIPDQARSLGVANFPERARREVEM